MGNTPNQWINGIKSKVNDRKVQFKRKRNNVGYRVAPNDVKNSLIKPSDFKFLTPKESESFAWELPDEIQQKKIRNNFINEVGKKKKKKKKKEKLLKKSWKKKKKKKKKS